MDILLTAEIQNLMAFMGHLWGLWGFVELNPFCIFLEVLIDVLRGLWNTFKRLFEKNAADGGGFSARICQIAAAAQKRRLLRAMKPRSLG